MSFRPAAATWGQNTIGDHEGLATLAAGAAPILLLAAGAGSVAIAVTGVVTAVRSRRRQG